MQCALHLRFNSPFITPSICRSNRSRPTEL